MRDRGPGPWRVTACDFEFLATLEPLFEPVVRGGLESPLRWTCSAASVAALKVAEGREDSKCIVNRPPHKLGLRIQVNRMFVEKPRHQDRDKEFQRINRNVRALPNLGQPAVRLGTKSELSRCSHTHDRDWHPKAIRSPWFVRSERAWCSWKTIPPVP